MNNVNIIGRVTKEIELRYLPANNTPVCSFCIAVDDGFGDKKKTYFINCQAWQKTAENIVKFFGKGDLIGISGRLTTRDWEDKEGKKHTVTEIVVNDFTFCNGKKSDAGGESRQQNTSYAAPHSDYPADPVDEDDDLPF